MRQGFVYVAFVIDVCALCIACLRASLTAHAGFILDALEQASHQGRQARDQLVHHSDRGMQYLSVKHINVGDSDDNALAEAINALFKAEVIHRRGPWRSFETVEYATPERLD